MKIVTFRLVFFFLFPKTKTKMKKKLLVLLSLAILVANMAVYGVFASSTTLGVTVSAGSLSISGPANVSCDSLTVSDTATPVACDFGDNYVTVTDLRDGAAGFTASTAFGPVSGVNNIAYLNNINIYNDGTPSSAVSSTLTGVGTSINGIGAAVSATGTGGTSDTIGIMTGSPIQREPGSWRVSPIVNILYPAFPNTGNDSATVDFSVS